MSETPPPPPPAAPQAPLSESDERLYASLSSAGNIIFPLIAPLIVWLIFRERSAFVDAEGKKALNFGILAVIVYIVGAVLALIIIGVFISLAMFVVAVIFGIQAAIKNNKGESYKYPFTLNLVK